MWKLVQLCDKHDDFDMKNLAGELLAVVRCGGSDVMCIFQSDSLCDEVNLIILFTPFRCHTFCLRPVFTYLDNEPPGPAFMDLEALSFTGVSQLQVLRTRE